MNLNVIKEKKSWSNNFQEFICNEWSDEKWKELKKIAIWNEFVLELDHHDPHCDRLFNNLHSLFSRTKGSILNPQKVGKKDQERIEKWWRKESRTRNDRRPLKILLVLLVKHLSVAQTQSNVITSTRISLLKQIFSVYSFSFSKWETGRGVSSKLFYSHRMEQASSTFLQYFITPRFEICRSLPVFLLLNHTVSDMVFFYGSLFEENGSFQVVIMILCLRLQIPTVSFLHCLLKKEIFKNIPRID